MNRASPAVLRLVAAIAATAAAACSSNDTDPASHTDTALTGELPADGAATEGVQLVVAGATWTEVPSRPTVAGRQGLPRLQPELTPSTPRRNAPTSKASRRRPRNMRWPHPTPRPAPQAARGRDRSSLMDTIRVMIFDDDLVDHPAFLAPVFAGLEARARHAFRIETTYRAHADAAVAEVAAWGPTLVFMDFQMRGHANGDVATAALRAVHTHDALPILAISSDSRFNRQLLMAGASESCPKMALPDELPDLFARLLALRA